MTSATRPGNWAWRGLKKNQKNRGDRKLAGGHGARGTGYGADDGAKSAQIMAQTNKTDRSPRRRALLAAG